MGTFIDPEGGKLAENLIKETQDTLHLKQGRPLGGWSGHGSSVPSQNVNRVSHRHKEIMRRLMLGQSQKDIAEIMGYTPMRISQIVNSPVFKKQFDQYQATFEQMFTERLLEKELHDPVREKLEEYKVDAIDTMYHLMRESESDTVRRASAQDILDRAGYKPRDVVETNHSFKVDPETSSNINQALRDLGIDANTLDIPEEEWEEEFQDSYDQGEGETLDEFQNTQEENI